MSLGVARNFEKDWAGKSITVVPAGGKNNLEKPIIIFREFGIKTYLLFDGDVSKKNNHHIADQNRKLLRLAGAPEQDFPKDTVAESWACFYDKLEKCIKGALGDVTFKKIAGEVKKSLGFDDLKKVLKNPEGMAQFIHLVYKKIILYLTWKS